MNVQDQPVGGPDSSAFTVGEIVELKMSAAPEMIVLRVWLAAELAYEDGSAHEGDVADTLTPKVQWCLCYWFTSNREPCEREFPASLLRRVSAP